MRGMWRNLQLSSGTQRTHTLINTAILFYFLFHSCSTRPFMHYRFKLYTQYCIYNKRKNIVQDASLEQDSTTCKLCDAKFESLDDMQRHMLTEHMQRRDYHILSSKIVNTKSRVSYLPL